MHKLAQTFFIFMLAGILFACGGGGSGGFSSSDNSSSSATTSNINIALILEKLSDGTATTSISTDSPGRLVATITDASGNVLAGVVVTFNATLAVFNPVVGTALTNAAGVASVELLAADMAGADTLTATVQVGEETFSTELGYEIKAPNISIGSGTPFTKGALLIGLANVSAGGTTSITARLVDDTGAAFTQPVDIVFTSTCVGSELATLSSPVTTINGSATSTYLAQGCLGVDTIVATANIGGSTITAMGTITVLAADLGAIEFISATPAIIALKGTGGSGLSETSTVLFRVVDEFGLPVANQAVDFFLNTTVGGLSLTNSEAGTNADGEVQTVVRAGTVATAVRVTATITGTSITTQSDQLAVTTGVPDNNSVSISATVLNPEAWDFDGVTVGITVFAADHFNNPVPDGTAVAFTTEGGAVGGSCITTGGSCSVNWNSQSPRPCGQTSGSLVVVLDPNLGPNVCVPVDGVTTNPVSPLPGIAPFGQPYGGRATITATLVGEESFIDINGNGVFDDGDTFTDLSEAFRDDNENGVLDPNEEFMDFNVNGTFDAADGFYNGVLCAHSTLCSPVSESLHARDSLVLIMSGSSAFIDIIPDAITVPYLGTASATLRISDLHNQPMPAGTEITIQASKGTVLTPSPFLTPSTPHNGALDYGITIGSGEPDATKTGLLTVTVTTPGPKFSDGTQGASTITVATATVFDLGPSGSPPGVEADLAVTLDDGSPAPAPSAAATDPYTYTAVLTNNGPDTANGVTLDFEVPGEVGFVSASTTQGGCILSGSTLECTLGTLANAASATVTIDVTAAMAGTASSSATVAAAESDPNNSNNVVGEFTTIDP